MYVFKTPWQHLGSLSLISTMRVQEDKSQVGNIADKPDCFENWFVFYYPTGFFELRRLFSLSKEIESSEFPDFQHPLLRRDILSFDLDFLLKPCHAAPCRSTINPAQPVYFIHTFHYDRDILQI